MDSRPPDESLLKQARAGDQAALGQLLDQHRDWLQRMAEGELKGRLPTRVSASDVVQQTCLSAIMQFVEFEGLSEAQFCAWLKGIHKHNIQDAVRRHVRARKRTIDTQQSLDAADSADSPPARTGSPSRRAIQDEATSALMAAIGQLPADQATAVRMRHLEQKSLRQIAQAMSRSEVAVASLLKRGLEAIRNKLGPRFDA